ncbi:hypothetical protein JZ751_009397 [Albula glossodonta]|uniref:Uncharacterized protein n=1 Tax=Albula glossodonta TaxID=121402 RepID=A0A8T2N1E6_9TELE|nr:hypothetical protein JZ751_009397 [Albula glossodonta]
MARPSLRLLMLFKTLGELGVLGTGGGVSLAAVCEVIVGLVGQNPRISSSCPSSCPGI